MGFCEKWYIMDKKHYCIFTVAHMKVWDTHGTVSCRKLFRES